MYAVVHMSPVTRRSARELDKIKRMFVIQHRDISPFFFVCSSKSSASPVLSNCEADDNDGGKEETCSTNDVRRMGKCEK